MDQRTLPDLHPSRVAPVGADGSASVVQLDSCSWLSAPLPAAEAASEPRLLAELDRLGALPRRPRPIVLDGAGAVADVLAAGGARTAPAGSDPLEHAAGSGAILVSVSDGPAPEHWDDLDSRAGEAGVAWHRAWFEGAVGYCGPLLERGSAARPHTPGAHDPGHRGTELRRRAADPQPDARAALVAHHRATACPPPAGAAALLAAVVVTDLATVDSRERARITLTVLHPDLSTTAHRVLPWPRGIQERPVR